MKLDGKRAVSLPIQDKLLATSEEMITDDILITKQS
jgi:hypothetical protein